MRKLALVLASVLAVAGCDNHKQQNAANAASGAAAGDVMPTNIAGADLPIAYTLWLDVPFGNGCSSNPSDFSNSVGLYYKPNSEAWPPARNNIDMLIDLQLPHKRFERGTWSTVINRVMSDLVRGGYVSVQRRDNNITGPSYCALIVTDRVGSRLNTYKDSNGTATRGLVWIGTFILDHVDHISTFQKIGPQGVPTEHRKYHLVAYLREDPQIGSMSVEVARDIVIFFDAENNAWTLDQDDQTAWTAGP